MPIRANFRSFGCVALLLFILLLGTIRLESVPPIWWDEGWNFTIARNWIERGYYGRFLADVPIPITPTNGFPVIASVALGFKLFGIGIWQARVLFTIFSLGTLALIYHLAYCLYGRSIALGALLVLILTTGYPSLHPMIMGRQALGDTPAIFYLLAGYVCFLMASKRALWVLIAICFWATALLTKLQVLPFWLISLLVPLAVCLYKKAWRLGGLIFSALISAVFIAQLLSSLLDSLLGNPTLPIPQLRGLYQVTALVFTLPARLFALIATVEFGLPTLLGLSHGLWSFLKVPHKSFSGTHSDVVRLALLVLSTSWFAWYVTLSVGWLRYLFPAIVIGSIFVAAMLYDFTNRFSLFFTLRETGNALMRFHFDRKSTGAFFVVLLVLIMVPRTLKMLYRAYSLDADASVQQVTHFLNTQTPTNALIETYDSEIFFLLQRRYHYPPDQLHVDLVRRTFLYDDDTSINYDPLAANPDYLIVGPHSKQWRLYEPILSTGAFRLRRAYNRYEIHERVR